LQSFLAAARRVSDFSIARLGIPRSTLESRIRSPEPIAGREARKSVAERGLKGLGARSLQKES
jgi:hypothetical protein